MQTIDDSSKEAVQVVLEFCQLQRRLVERFMDVYQPKDQEWFSDVARVSALKFEKQSWRCARHGAGICFETTGSTVDAHVGLAVFADAVDGWRLLQFLASRKIELLAFEGELYAADDEKTLGVLLEEMTNAGILNKSLRKALVDSFVP